MNPENSSTSKLEASKIEAATADGGVKKANDSVFRKNKFLSKLSKFSRLNYLRNYLHAFAKRTITPAVASRLEYLFVLLPGMFFIGMGLSALIYPQLVILLAAGFCLSFGTLLCIFSAKFLKLKRKFSKFTHQIEARLIIDPSKSGNLQDFEKFDHKKEFFH